MRVEDSLESMIRSLTRVVDGNMAMPVGMVRDVRDLLVLIRNKELAQRGNVIEPQSLRVVEPWPPRLRVVE